MGSGSPRICFDRSLPPHLEKEAARLAVRENPANPPADGLPIGVERRKVWRPGRTLGIRFLDGSERQRAQVKRFAVEWLDHANLKFDFDAGPDAEIRISFKADEGSWSAVGTDCLLEAAFPRNEPTMNYGWLTDDTDDTECRRVVLHEFGHALGAIHEHQSPLQGIRWNLPRVYQYFSGPPNNWSEDEINFNVVHKYAKRQINGTVFDKDSIMLYSFPKELIKDATEDLPSNNTLSAGDKAFMARVYPNRKA